MSVHLAEQPVMQRHPRRKNVKTEKQSEPTAQTNSNPRKRLLLSQISESLTSQLDHSKYGDNASSASFSSDSSRTLHYNFLGNESQPYKRSINTPCHSHPTFFPSDQSAPSSPSQTRRKDHATVLTLEDIAAVGVIEKLVTQYRRVSHMGILDPRYSLFVNKARTAALSFKVHNKVALVMGDPLCKPELFTEILREFKEYRKKSHWGVAFIGASEVFAAYAKQHKWTTLQFGTERVLNPMMNDVLNEWSGKRIIVQCKQLLNPRKGNIALGVYVPSLGEDLDLHRELDGVYDSWRQERNHAVGAKAFITVYDPFSMPGMMTYVYTRGPDGVANGFAALRRLGANSGYHIDPCVAAPGAPRGITDLLVFAAMALLHSMGVSYLTLGFEPLESLADITRMPLPIEQITRAIYKRTFKQMLFKGKQAYHDKFKPDASQGSPLYTLFPTGAPSPRQWVAVSHMSNISIRRLFLPRTGRKPGATK